MHGTQVYFVGDYKMIMENSVDVTLGPTRETKDYLQKVIIMPLALDVGIVIVKDGKDIVFGMMNGPWPDLRPFSVQLLFLAKDHWKFTTGPNVRLLVVGDFDTEAA